jgi:hypothetical protein
LSKANFPGLKIVWFRNPLYDDRGFYPKEKPEIFIEWNQIIRVAQLVWTDVVACETENYWAFQGNDSHSTCWVLARYRFSEEIANRYGNPKTPHVTKWSTIRITGGELCNYVIWPHAEIGEAMYMEMKKKFWELKRKIAYRKM